MLFKKLKARFWSLVILPRMLNSAYKSASHLIQRNAALPPDSVLILPASDVWEEDGKHSFGDEMLMLGLLEGLKNKFAGNISVLAMEGQYGRDLSIHGYTIKTVGFKDGWYALSSYRQFLDIVAGYSHFVVMGADVLDGAYGSLNSIQRLRFLNLAAQSGVKTAITACSFNGTRDRRIIELLTKAQRSGTVIHAREKVSHDRLNVFLSEVKGVADLAFGVDAGACQVAPRVEAIWKRAAEWKAASGKVVGLNLCGWHIKDMDRFYDDFTKLIDQLASLKLAFVLIPHDTRTHAWSDLATLEEFRRRFDSCVKILGYPNEIRTGIDAKQAVRCCDVLLTGRLHLAIAAHDQGVPAISFSYQGKFEGFYALFGMGKELMVSYEDLSGVAVALQKTLEQRIALSARIMQRIDAIRSSTRANFMWLEEPLRKNQP